MKYKILMFFLLTTAISYAQVKGKVTDQKTGDILPGVSIVIKGTITGTITDFNGEYAMKASPGDSLLFSFIGYKPISVAVGSNTTINVKMEENQQEIDEVVVVGYGVQKRVTLQGL